VIIKKGTCALTDVAISGDRNVTKKVAEKILKCEDLITEIQRMGNVKTEVIPIIVWGKWNRFKINQKKNLGNIPRQFEIKELQKKTAIFGTAHILREVLM
jgi:hypothetical protein